MESYKHFAHKHSLTLYHHISSKMTCHVCKLQLWDDFYGCKPCNCYICRSCYKLPREMRHPFHKEHPLTLFAESPYDSVGDTYCNACSNKIDGFSFHCSECEFDLDFNCATLMPTTTTTKKEEEMIIHPHPLICCDRKNRDVDFSCSMCQLSIKGNIYVCLDDLCGAILHKSCAQLPQQITHKFHPQHSLTLRHSLTHGHSDCNACRHFKGKFLYNCCECEFNLDVRCASLVPKAAIEENQLVLVEPHSFKFTHSHSLIPCDTKGNFSFLCSACEISIEDKDEDGTVTVYVCLECGLLLHKSCAELPPRITHPFHPPHTLVLENERSSYSCDACKCSVRGFKYWCYWCKFAIDVTCASQSYSTYKDQLHKHHPLAIFNHNKRDNKPTANKCHYCKRGPISFPFLRCVPCDFTVDLCCHYQLPREFKHSCHDRHSLTLTRSPVKDNSDDDDDSEYYCDLCEKRRELRDPTYYCAQCHYVAHLTCVFDEILPLLERERDEEIVKLQAEVDALSSKLETLITKLDELKEKLEQRVSEYQVASRLEAEIENESTDTKAVLCATRDDPTIAKLDEEIIMVRAEIDALTTKLNQLEKRREQRIGVMEVDIKNASTKKKLSLSARRDALFLLSFEDLTIIDAEDDIIRLQADIDALTVKLKRVKTKLDGLKESREQHIGGISSLDTESALAFLANFDDVVKKGCNVKSVKKEEDEESDGTFTTLAELDKEIEAITTKLEALKKKRSRHVSGLKLK